MSYAALKLVHSPTGVGASLPAFLTHLPPPASSSSSSFLPSTWSNGGRSGGLPSASEDALPNLVVVKANVLEVYNVRVQEGDEMSAKGDELIGAASVAFPATAKRGGYMSGITAAWLELACHCRLHGVVESVSVLSGRSRNRKDALLLTFREAKFSVLYFDAATQKLKTSSMHYFEGPEWVHLKRGREKFPTGPLARADPLGSCAAVLIYKCQLVLLKAKAPQEVYGLEEEEGSSSGANGAARIDSSYIINLDGLEMRHIKDFVFLYGYTEPVVLVLYEKEPTWAGRLQYRRDTCSITALSINTNLKQHPKLWERNELPYDAYSLLPVPSPIGGALVLCANSILYFNQVSACMLALNDMATPFRGSLEPRAKFSVELDAARGTWLSHDVALFSTKTGMLLLLYLLFDGSNVQRLELVKSRASILSSSICTIGDSFFFLGSRLADSLLVQFTGTDLSRSDREESDEIEGDVMVRPSKRLRLNVEDPAELPFYRDAPKSMNFAFSVRDSFVNVGPLRDITNTSSNELVACSGHGKNGCLAILNRSLHPKLITQETLGHGCKGAWTVYHKPGQFGLLDASSGDDGEEEYHAYLILSLESRTMVLETKETLGEVTDSVDYYTQGPTIAAGNMFGRRRIAQVYQRGIRLLNGAVQTQDLQVTDASSDVVVCAATVADPYILLQMTDGTVQLVTIDENYSVAVTSSTGLSHPEDPITASMIYHDKGWLRKTSGDAWQSLGVSDSNFFDSVDIYCVLCRASGKLEFYELPSLDCMYRVEKFQFGLQVLLDERVATTGLSDPTIATEASEEGNEEIRDRMQKMRVTEIFVETWGEKSGRPFLFALLSDGTLLCYRAFFYEGAENSQTNFFKNLRFYKLHLDLELGEEDVGASCGAKRIIPFKDIGGLQGVFLAGAKPVWLMILREQIRAHSQPADAPIVAFTSLHIVDCRRGFIYLTSQGEMKICRLPEYLNYDSDWPVQKMPLKCTPHQLAYYADANIFAVIVSSMAAFPANVVLPSVTDLHSGPQMEQNEMLDGGEQNTVTLDEFEIRILNPMVDGVPWETKATMKMQPTENALTIRIVNIRVEGTDRTQNLLAIGTAYVQGEDVAARGRIILASIGPSDDPDTWVKELYSKEQKGAISALTALQGRLLVAVGPKILLHVWNGSELTGTAFFDAPLYVVSLNIVKNFVLFGDYHKSIYFMVWKEEGSQLVLLAKDFGSLDCYATEFLIDGSTLSLLVSDSRKNIQVFSYAPKSAESWKGQKLLPRVEFHLGSHITKFIRLQMLPTSTQRLTRFALCFGTLDGSIGYVAPVDELTFRRLQMLQGVLLDVVPHTAGLNPKAFRQLYSAGEYHRTGPDNALDYDQLRQYEAMPLDQQMTVARQIGTTRQQIFANLRDISQSTDFF